MRRNFVIALMYTVVTTVIFGIVYPLAVTGIAQLLFKNKADGQLLTRNGEMIGSRLIGQPFSSPLYFHSRPSAAGSGYDAADSGGSNLGPTSEKLVERIKVDAATESADGPGTDVPVDLVTASASGLDPHVTPAGAEYQVTRVAHSRHMTEEVIRNMVSRHTEGRQLGFLGEPRVNVLELNLDLDQSSSVTTK